MKIKGEIEDLKVKKVFKKRRKRKEEKTIKQQHQFKKKRE